MGSVTWRKPPDRAPRLHRLHEVITSSRYALLLKLCQGHPVAACCENSAFLASQKLSHEGPAYLLTGRPRHQSRSCHGRRLHNLTRDSLGANFIPVKVTRSSIALLSLGALLFSNACRSKDPSQKQEPTVSTEATDENSPACRPSARPRFSSSGSRADAPDHRYYQRRHPNPEWRSPESDDPSLRRQSDSRQRLGKLVWPLPPRVPHAGFIA